MLILKSLFFLTLMRSAKTQCPSWGYSISNGPSNFECWPNACQDGSSQSPIDIPHARNLSVVKHWLPFRWLNYHEEWHHLNVTNTGTTARIEVSRDCGRPRVQNGGLGSTFELDHILLHWGSRHTRGSEHTIHGERSRAEVQFVHVNEECGRTVQEALYICSGDFPNAFAIFSVLLEIGEEDNEHYKPLFDAIDHVTLTDSTSRLSHLELMDLYPEDRNQYYRYMGSFTTPNLECMEQVVWTVFKDKVKVSKHQLSKLWQLKTNRSGVDERLINNFRATQALNEREVIYANLELKCVEKGWKLSHGCSSIQYKEQKTKMDFLKSFQHCSTYEGMTTPRSGLITLGKLRCLRNSYEYGPKVIHNTDDICGRYFRVNGYKNRKGEWQEYGSGNWVPFHHFPDFDQSHGKEGDTLVWDALTNRLIIATQEEKYYGLCYKELESCEHCVGSALNHECSDSGYCHDGTCNCDATFIGKLCEVTPIPSKDIVTVGSIDSENDSRINSKQTRKDPNVYCILNQYTNLNPSAEVEMFCDFIFGRVFCCGGHTHPDLNAQVNSSLPNTNICGFLDCHDSEWKRIHDFPLPLYFESAVAVKIGNEDFGWIASGGEYDDGTQNVMQDRMYILKHDLRWETLRTQMPRKRSGHCSVQINECEIALIGGGEGIWHQLDQSGDYYVANTLVSEIDIYNFKTNTWRNGPKLPENMLRPGCARIKDHLTNELKIIIGCDSTTSNLWAWDISTNDVYAIDHVCPNVASNIAHPMKFKELDDQNIAVLNGPTPEDFFYNMVNGFTSSYVEQSSKYKGDSAVAPPGIYECSELEANVLA